jgi:5'-nucleotidase/UDP-sugar diphosphatase
VLPFANVLIELRLSGRQILEVLEDAVANHLDRNGSDGSHPYAAGLRWDLDMSRPRGSRFANVEIKSRVDGAWQALDPRLPIPSSPAIFWRWAATATRTLAQIHLAGGSVNTYLNYTQTFVDYLLAQGRVSRPAAADYSHQRVIGRDGRVLP